MKVIIPAAGKGSRLGHLTQKNTKCMVDFIDGKIIDHTLSVLGDLNYKDIIIVTGFEADGLVKYLDKYKNEFNISFVHNEDYDKTNNIVSIYKALESCNDDVLIIESDLVFEKSIIEGVDKTEHECLAVVDDYKIFMDGGAVKTDKDKVIFYKPEIEDIKNGADKTVNIYFMKRSFVEQIYMPLLEIYIKNDFTDRYYEDALSVVGYLPKKMIFTKNISGSKWYEIDTINDLDVARSMFSSHQYQELCERWGGYWRYEGITEFNLLVNPYYPNKEMKDVFAENIEVLMHSYPSGYNIQNKLFSSIVDIKEENVRVHNGASETISLMAELIDQCLILGPTFKEYQNRIKKYKIIDDFDLFEQQSGEFKFALIVNPNNPTGSLIHKEKILNLIRKNSSTVYIIDESFMDFSSSNESIISEEYVSELSNLVVIKSIGKSHGIGGLRLGGLITSNDFILQNIKKPPIWNINSFAEFYMQNYKQNEQAFKNSLEIVKKTRDVFYKRIRNIDGVRVFKSEANFIFIQIDNQKYQDLCEYMLEENILIKVVDNGDLKGIRIAVKTENENDKLVCALKKYFSISA